MRSYLLYMQKELSILLSIFFLIFNIFFTSNSIAADSLSYSGRLVQTNGAPVAGPVNLLLELSYTNAPTTILCSQSFSAVVLSNGVFHLKLDFNCGANGTIAEVLTAVPANESAAIRVTDVSNSKTYSWQAMHSMPFASIAGTAKQLVQMGAADNQVLKWNNTLKKWEPGVPGGGGTVTGVSGTLPISVATGTSTPVISISQSNTTTNGYLSSTDWNTFNNKQGSIAAGTTAQYYRGDKSWQTLDTSSVPENLANLYFTNARVLGVPLTGFSAGTGAINATDTTLAAFGKAQGQINAINTASSNYLIKNGADTISGTVSLSNVITATATGDIVVNSVPLMLTSAVNKTYVDTADALKVDKAGDTVSGILTLDSDLKIKGGTNYVTLRGHATSAAFNLILPSTAGTSGYVLQTDGAGNLSWINPSTTTAGTGTVSSASIDDGTIVDADINASAAIAQSKILNLTTDLAAKQTTTLTNGNILVGNVGNVATSVAVSGDATIINTGALTLKNTGTAGTYSQVTTDAQGRVTSGSNPTVVNSISVTAPITNTGTAAIPSLAMPAATTSVDGYLSAADWTIFNNKQTAISDASTINTGSVTTNLQGGVVVNPYGTLAGNTGEVRFNELVANGTNYVALKAPDALVANVTYTFPLADGSSGQVLTTNAAGVLSWSSVATTSTTLVGDVDGTIGANTIGAGKVTLTHLSATGTKDATTYLKGNNTWGVFQTDVQASLLSAYAVGANAVVAATDSVVGAFGKLQKQITDLSTSSVGGDLTGNLPNPTVAKLQGGTLTITTPATKNVLKYNGSAWVNSMVAAGDLSATGTVDATTYLAGDNTWKNLNTNVIAAPLTGLSATATKATSTLAATDSITAAFNKLLFTQGDYVSKSVDQTINGTLAINSLTGFITVPTPINANDAANKGYVDGFGQWSKGTGANAADIYRSGSRVGIGVAAPGSELDVSGTLRTDTICDRTGANCKTISDGWSTGTAGSALGILAYAKRSDTTELTFSGTIPEDNTVPQVTEGSELLAISVTVPVGVNFLYFNIEHLNYGETSNHSNLFTVALFRDGQTGTDALAAFAEEGDYGTNAGSINTTLRVAAPAAGTYTYRIRGGFAAGSFYLNRGFNAMSSLAGNLNQTSITVLGDASGSAPASNYWSEATGGINFSSGNVGIGTNTPILGLDINNGTTTPPSTTATPNGTLSIGSSATGLVLTAGVETTNTISFLQSRHKSSATFYPLALNPSGGNVGIGTTTPAQKLDVVGTVKATQIESSKASYVRVLLNQCAGPCASYHGLGVWTNIAGYTHSLATNDSSAYTVSGTTGSITVNKAGTYRVKVYTMVILTAAGSHQYGCPFINGAASCPGASGSYVPHRYTPAGSWSSQIHEFLIDIPAGTVMGYGYYTGQAMDYWAHDGYTGMEILRQN